MRQPKLTSPRTFSAPRLGARAQPEVTAEPVANRAEEFVFGSWSDGLRALANAAVPVIERERAREKQQADKRDQYEGEAEAFRDLNQGQFSRRDSFSIRDEAYNRAGISAMAARIDADSAIAVMELSQKHAADPAAFRQAVEGYAFGVSGELARTSPALAMDFKSRIMQRSVSYIERIAQRKADLVRDASEADLLRFDAATDALLDDVSGDLFSGNAKLSAAAVTQVEGMATQYLATMERLGPDGRPVFSEVQKEQARQMFFARAIEEGLTKWFRTVDDLPAAILKFTDGDLNLAMGGEVLDVSAMLPPEARLRVLRVAEAVLADRNSQAETLVRAREKATDKAQELRYFQHTDAMLAGALTADTVRADVAAGKITGTHGNTLLKGIRDMANSPRASDSLVLQNVYDMLYVQKVDATSYIMGNLDGLSREDAQKFLGVARTMFSEKGDPTAMTSEQSRYFSLLEKSLQTGSIFKDADPNEKTRVTSALDEYMQRVVVEGELPQEVFKDLRDRAQGPGLEFDPTQKLVRPSNPIYSSTGRLDIGAMMADLEIRRAGMTEAQYFRQGELLMQWYEAYQQLDTGGAQ